MKYRGISLIIASAVIILSLILIPGSTVAESPEATVRIECAGGYWGTITGDETETIEGEGTMDFQVRGEIIYVIMTKANEDYNEMKVSIMVDGNTRMTKSTTDPMGEVRMSYSLGAEGDPFDESEEGNSEGSQGILCVETFTMSIIFILVCALIFAWIRKALRSV